MRWNLCSSRTFTFHTYAMFFVFRTSIEMAPSVSIVSSLVRMTKETSFFLLPMRASRLAHSRICTFPAYRPYSAPSAPVPVVSIAIFPSPRITRFPLSADTVFGRERSIEAPTASLYLYLELRVSVSVRSPVSIVRLTPGAYIAAIVISTSTLSLRSLPAIPGI